MMARTVEPRDRKGASFGGTRIDSASRRKRRMGCAAFLIQLYCRFQDDEVPALGAQLTYYLILAFFPFLIFVIALLSFTEISASEVIDSMARIMPNLSSRAVADAFEEIQRSRSGSVLSVGLLAALWSASNGIGAVMKALNKAYDEEESRPFWKVKGISVLFTLVLAIVVLFTFVLLIFGKIVGAAVYKFVHFPGNFDLLWGFIQYVIPLVTIAVVFILLYRYTPNLRLTFGEVLPGALFATAGWVAASLLFSYYVNHFGSYTKTYGSIGGIIVLLTWLYLSSIVMILGGEINATLHFDRHGKQKPSCKPFGLTLRSDRRD
ncbi:YihY/virulence factor BrkB family protein [Paenibacillus elgii]|uniref:YihY/virulence factor BrkB family protein n=1 Tax=Paenibacillus elgii TaxID=189691 RepID=UPI0030D760AA